MPCQLLHQSVVKCVNRERYQSNRFAWAFRWPYRVRIRTIKTMSDLHNAEQNGTVVTVKRVTLADVARRAGTSTAVVSYVLNDGPRPVSEALRARVLEALDDLDYRPDRIARALRRPSRWR